jgi:hypothetical protein
VKNFSRKINIPIIICLIIASLLTDSVSANAVNVDQIIWRNPPAGSMTSPGSFLPAWSGVTGGTARAMSATFNFTTGNCGTTWTDLGNASSITLEDAKCYLWTFDPSRDASAVKPTQIVLDQSTLTSGILKVSSSACTMDSSWDGDVVTITYGLPNPASGIDCKTEFSTPKNLGKMSYLLVGGGGAGGWASTVQSQGGGGGGGGGTSFTQVDASVTPGRTYAIQVGAGAIVGTRNNGNISCLRGEVGATSTSVQQYGGTSKLGKFIAEGGGCAQDTGGIERGSDGGISANGRTGGRGGSCYSRTCEGGFLILPTTTFYTTNPRTTDQLSAWEGAGGGGGASFSTNPNSACNYGNPNWSFFDGCDGWDIAGVGAFGGIGGAGIESWYQGACNYYFGGGGGGGGSTPLTNAGNSYLGVTRNGVIQEYIWNVDHTEFANGTGHYYAKNWMPLGGRGGLGGGGQAATSTTNWSTTAPDNALYQHAQNGTDGCGGGGGGGQANKSGAYQAQQVPGPPLSDDYGNPIFVYQGNRYRAVLDNNHNLTPVTDETIDSYWGLNLYEQSDNPANQIAVNSMGDLYTVQSGGLYNIIGSSTNTPSGARYTAYIWGEAPFTYFFNEIYDVGNHHFTVVSSAAELDPGPDPVDTSDDTYVIPYSEVYSDHYIQYVDQNGVTAYLDAAGYFDFYYQSGYQYAGTLQPARDLVGRIEPTAQTLDEPGKGGNGLVAIRFSLTSNYGNQFNPAIKVPAIQKVWPNLTSVIVPVSLRQSGGSGYVCIKLADPSNPDNDYSAAASIRIRLGSAYGASLSESQTATQLKTQLSKLTLGKSVQDFLIRDRDPWVRNREIVLRVNYSGSDSIATNVCSNSLTDIPVGGTPLVQYVTLQRISATQVRNMQVLPKNGRQNN